VVHIYTENAGCHGACNKYNFLFLGSVDGILTTTQIGKSVIFLYKRQLRSSILLWRFHFSSTRRLFKRMVI